MEFDLTTARPVLARTPEVLHQLLRDLPEPFIIGNEGPDTWSPFDVVGHLLQGERFGWMPRAYHLLEHGEASPFPKFDPSTSFEDSKGKTLGRLLDEFAEARRVSLGQLDALHLTSGELQQFGQHVLFGRVTLSQLLATWVAHDLDHIVQISRCMARQYTEAVGPWYEVLRVVRPV